MLNNDDKNYVNVELENYDTNIEHEIQYLKKLEEVQVLIDKLDFEDLLTADEFI